MEQQTWGFDEHFQRHYVSHFLRDNTFYQEVREDVVPELFTSDNAQRVVRVAQAFGLEHGSPPGELIYTELERLGQKVNTIDLGPIREYLDRIFALELQNRSFLLRAHARFFRNQKFQRRLPSLAKHIKQGEFENAEKILHELVVYRAERSFSLGQGMRDVAARIKRREEQHKESIWTLIPELDRLIDGIKPGELGVLLSQRSSIGKAQPLASKILTDDGWKTMGDIEVGDVVASTDGRLSAVTGVFPQGKKPVYRVLFSDGRSTECCGEHLWQVERSSWTEVKVLSTDEIREKLDRSSSRPITIPVHSGQWGRERELPIDPWLLGILLGDAHIAKDGIRLSNPDQDVLDRVQDNVASVGLSIKWVQGVDWRISNAECVNSGPHTNELLQQLRKLGLTGKRSWEKHAPHDYLVASREQRLEFLRGLMDSDGTCGKEGTPTWTTTSEVLAEQVLDLIRGLGMQASIASRTTTYTHNGEKRNGRKSYRVTLFGLTDNPFWLERKASRVRLKKVREKKLFVRSIELVGEKEVQCISVSAADRLYVTDDHIVTHNTTAMVHLLVAAVMQGKRVMVYTLEESEEDYQDRIDQRVAGLTKKQLSNEAEISRAMRTWFRFGGDVRIKQFPGGSTRLSDLKRHLEIVRNTENFYPHLIILDQAEELAPEGQFRGDQLYAAGKEIYTNVRGWAVEEELSIWTGAHANRGGSEATVADQEHIGGSIAKVQIADIIISLNRTKKEHAEGLTTLFISKARNRPNARRTITIKSDLARQAFYKHAVS